MLGLGQQVGGDELGIGGLVGDHRDLRGPGQEVDSDAAEELALGLGHEGVARPDDHVDRTDALESEGHRREGLDPAEREDPVGARSGDRVEGRGMDRALTRRRADAHLSDAGDLRYEHGHESAGQHRHAARRAVGAHRMHRNLALTQKNAG